MVAALDFGKRVADHVQEFFVGGDNGAVQREFHDGVGFVDRLRLAELFVGGALFLGDVDGELDDFDRVAGGVQHRAVGGLEPDFLTVPADALVFAGFKLAVLHFVPEGAVFRAVALLGFDQDGVMAAFDFIEAVAQGIEKVFIRGEDDAVGGELGDGVRGGDRAQFGRGVLEFLYFCHGLDPDMKVRTGAARQLACRAG